MSLVKPDTHTSDAAGILDMLVTIAARASFYDDVVIDSVVEWLGYDSVGMSPKVRDAAVAFLKAAAEDE